MSQAQTAKKIYLYRVSLTIEGLLYYYFGIRVCKGDASADVKYNGSPTANKLLWKKATEIKKVILHEVDYNSDNLLIMRNKEVEIISEAHNLYGVYGKDENGRCLNVSKFPVIVMTEQVRSKISESVKKYIKNNPEKKLEHNRKVSETMRGDNNPSKRAEVRAKMSEARRKYHQNNPEYTKKLNQARWAHKTKTKTA